jgi:hypothetical protein
MNNLDKDKKIFMYYNLIYLLFYFLVGKLTHVQTTITIDGVEYAPIPTKK